MDFFGLDEHERVIAETAAAFAEKRLAPYALEWDAAKHFPTDVLREAAELGMAAIYCREDVGGSELRRLDAVRIFEQLAAADPTVAAFLSIHNMCAWMVDTYGTDEQRKSWVPRLASMEAIASYCLTEPGAGSDAGALRTKAVRGGPNGDYVLDGVKQFISGAGSSDVYVVMARTGAEGPRGISAFLVEKDSPGLSFGADELKMGWNAQPTAQVIFDGVRVPAEAMLGGVDNEGTGFGIAMNGLNGGRINIAACSLGGRAGRPRQGGGIPRRPAGIRQLAARRADHPVHTGGHGHRPAGIARPVVARRDSAWTITTRRRSSCARWPSATSPTPASRWRIRRCNCTADTAICVSTVWRRSSAICGCIGSWRAPTKSCVWSSVGPRRPGPARRLKGEQ